jgi:hypothetical protein
MHPFHIQLNDCAFLKTIIIVILFVSIVVETFFLHFFQKEGQGWALKNEKYSEKKGLLSLVRALKVIKCSS